MKKLFSRSLFVKLYLYELKLSILKHFIGINKFHFNTYFFKWNKNKTVGNRDQLWCLYLYVKSFYIGHFLKKKKTLYFTAKFIVTKYLEDGGEWSMEGVLLTIIVFSTHSIKNLNFKC